MVIKAVMVMMVVMVILTMVMVLVVAMVMVMVIVMMVLMKMLGVDFVMTTTPMTTSTMKLPLLFVSSVCLTDCLCHPVCRPVYLAFSLFLSSLPVSPFLLYVDG